VWGGDLGWMNLSHSLAGCWALPSAKPSISHNPWLLGCWSPLASRAKALNQTEAIETAIKTTARNGWPWLGQVRAVRKKSLFREPIWRVRTNCEERGCNVYVEIDDASGAILKALFLPS
jgi:hypothetical protein